MSGKGKKMGKVHNLLKNSGRMANTEIFILEKFGSAVRQLNA